MSDDRWNRFMSKKKCLDQYLMFVRKKSLIFIFISSVICFLIIFVSWSSTLLSVEQFNTSLRYATLKENSTRIQRAIIIFYPSEQENHYLPELRWLYRSWLEMMKDESNDWRTDLVIFTGKLTSSLEQLGCLLHKIRLNSSDPSTCRVFLYVRLADRQINSFTKQQFVFLDSNTREYFHVDQQRSKILYQQLEKYGYIDSVNIIAEGYPIFQPYNFILKTDIDVFITRPFAKFVPIEENSLLFGRGGYSTDFNTNRLRRVAENLGWKYQNMTNIGSTWYGSPLIAQSIANYTLDAMLHLNQYEFTRPERESRLGVLLWPDWHYGVLSMYGTHLAVNHLISTKNFDIRKTDQLLDQSTTSTDENDIEKHNRLHLHCWHTDKPFSKFQFKADRYNHIHPRTLLNNRSAQAYAMRMALESRLLTLEELHQHLKRINENRTSLNRK